MRIKLGFLFAFFVGCGDPEIVNQNTGGTGGDDKGGSGGEGGDPTFVNSSSSSGTSMDPCEGVVCDEGFACAGEGGNAGNCVALTCADLNCGPTEECIVLPNGGAKCVDISCNDDVDCPLDRFCNGTICVIDTCIPGEESCVGQTLFACAPNGSASNPQYTCGSTAYFPSTCNSDGMGDAYCGCQDDWDCPNYTVCDVDQCAGTGFAPTCSLPPADFSMVLPAPEIQWGGTSEQQRLALGRPHPPSAQVVMTPIVANLDDDNGDGLINERDFPEIIFVTFCNSEISANGVVRAIHGGGPNKGLDYFAVCGTETWREGDALPTTTCASSGSCAGADVNSTAGIAVGDIDGDGRPEIVAITEGRGVQIIKNDGTVEYTSPINQWPATNYVNPAPAIANLDNAGFAEVVVGKYVFTFAHDVNGNIVLVDKFSGSLTDGTQSQGPVPCLANLVGDTRSEIIAGTTAYGFPKAPVGATKIADCALFPPQNPEETAFCNGQLTVVWDGQAVNGTTLIPNNRRDGFCAVADILGANPDIAPSPTNPPDGMPEVILINDGYLLILEGATGTLKRNIALGGGVDGGAPNVDDFDGDGFPEVGSAFGTTYQVIDLQDTSVACPAWPTALTDALGLSGPQGNPARTPPSISCMIDADCEAMAAGTACNKTTRECVCQHNGWKRQTEDDSSRVTGSSVFDFNGDGGAEVIYNDECFFRIYDGVSASVLFKEPSESRTRIEYPVVADVDNDGNAEIVFATSNESGFCSVGASYNYNNGLEVWGDPSDSWVSARRIWNEHAYHVTNVTEGGGIPVTEPESWKNYNGRIYNTYRSNPRSFGVAPDLVVSAIQVSSPDAMCGTLSDRIDITFQIENRGDLRVGPGVVVRFFGTWGAQTDPLYADLVMTPLEVVLQTSLEPGDSTVLTATYDAAWSAQMTLPDSVTVRVDALNQAAECVENNNDLTEAVVAGAMTADLRVSIDAIALPCPPKVTTTVYNDGSVAASNVVVRYFAGDPNQGGTFIADEVVPQSIPAGGMVTFTPSLVAFPIGLDIIIYAVVDPADLIEECNDGNNKDAADQATTCVPN
jgi:hypothetical protein